MSRVIFFLVMVLVSLGLTIGFWSLVIWLGANIVKGVFGL